MCAGSAVHRQMPVGHTYLCLALLNFSKRTVLTSCTFGLRRRELRVGLGMYHSRAWWFQVRHEMGFNSACCSSLMFWSHQADFASGILMNSCQAAVHQWVCQLAEPNTHRHLYQGSIPTPDSWANMMRSLWKMQAESSKHAPYDSWQGH